jgi:hypothetical protein
MILRPKRGGDDRLGADAAPNAATGKFFSDKRSIDW